MTAIEDTFCASLDKNTRRGTEMIGGDIVPPIDFQGFPLQKSA